MHIVFYAGSCLPFDAETLDKLPLGGTETAVIRLAEELAARGLTVSVFTNAPQPRSNNGVTYSALSAVTKLPPVSAFISVRDYRPLIHPFRTEVKLLWTGDAADQLVTFGIGDKRVANAIDGLLAVSHWQASSLCQLSGFPITKTFALGNGVHLPFFSADKQRRRKRLVYSSTPYRGLKFLPEIFKRIKILQPDSELKVFSGFEVYAGSENFPAAVRQEFAQTAAALKAIDGCSLVGNVTQRDLAEELLQAGVMAYPNTFFETSCISALEAQAAGAVVVTSRRGALPETLGDAGIFIDGEPGSEAYTVKFVEAINRLLIDNDLWQRHSSLGQKQIQSFSTWQLVGQRFLGYLNERFQLA